MTKKEMYRKLSKKFHPDVGGDTEIFKEINEAYNFGIDKLAKIYRDLFEEDIEIEIESSDHIDKITKHGSEYNPEIFEGNKNYYRPSKGYNTNTTEGMMRFWADSLIDRASRIKFIENLVVSGIEVRITIRWIKPINGKEYWQVSSTSGKFWNFDDYTNAILKALKIQQLGELKNINSNKKRRLDGRNARK